MLDSIKKQLKKSDFVVTNYVKIRNIANDFLYSESDLLRRQYRKIIHEKRVLLEKVDPDKAMIGEIEINKNCNLNCLMCNTQLSERKQFNMDLALFEKSVRHAKDLTNDPIITLHTIGEPLLNPKLPAYFEIMRSVGVKVKLSTNCTYLKKKLDLLCDNADVISSIRFSIDGASKETYEKIRKFGKWETLIENLDAFKKRNQEGKYFSHISVDSIVSTDVRSELAYHLEFYSQYAPMENIGLNLVNGLSLDNSYFLETSILKKHIVPTENCGQLNGRIHILNDGSASTCCRDYNAELTYGNIKDSTPKELINNDTIVELRRQHLENRIPKDSLCANCHEIDPRVAKLFKLFTAALVKKYKNNWNRQKVQQHFDSFFEAFANEVPDEDKFIRLLA